MKKYMCEFVESLEEHYAVLFLDLLFIMVSLVKHSLAMEGELLIGLIMVFNAILMSRQTRLGNNSVCMEILCQITFIKHCF